MSVTRPRRVYPCLLLLAGACATAPVNDARLLRALVPPQWELTVGTAHPTEGAVEGVVVDHRAIAGEGRVRQLTLDVGGSAPAAPPVRALLRYALPGARAIPVQVGSAVTIELQGQASPAGAALRVTDELGLRAALGDATHPTEQRPSPALSITPSPTSSYRESMRLSGFCEGRVEHRAAAVTAGVGTAATVTVIHTGEARIVRSGDEAYEAVLADHAIGDAEGCPDLELDHFSYLLLAVPLPPER